MLIDKSKITEIKPEEFMKRANELGGMSVLENLKVQNVDFSLLKNNINLQNCEFTSVSFRSKPINEGYYITMNHCEISQETRINNNCKLNSIAFHDCTLSRLYLSDITQTEIHFKNSVISKVEVKGSIYKLEITGIAPSFGVMESTRSEIDQLLITDTLNSNITGHINIYRIRVNNIKMEGTNVADVIFKDILNKKLEMIKFYNQGQVSFYGISNNVHWLPYNFDYSLLTTIDIVESNLSNVNLFRFNFSHYKSIRILDSLVVNMQFNNVTWKDNLLKPSTSNDILNTKQIKESYRQLKLAMKNQADRIQEIQFYAQEMKYQNEITGWTYNLFKDIFWDKLNLTLSYQLSRFGLSFWRPLTWFLGINYIFYLLLNFELLTINLSHIDFGSEFSNYLELTYPLRKLKENLTGLEVTLNILSRFSAAYFLYLIGRYSRKFISK